MMKRKNKLLTMLLASAVGVSAAVGGAMLYTPNVQSADAVTAATIFTGTNASVDSATAEYVKFNFSGSLSDTTAKVTYKDRSVALSWMTGKAQEENFTTTFSFEDAKFTTAAMVLEAASSVATKTGKFVNKVLFTNDGNKITVSIVNGENEVAPASEVVVSTKSDIKIKLSRTNGSDQANSGEFFVTLTETTYKENDATEEEGDLVVDQVKTHVLGKFINIASNLAEYKSGEDGITPFYFECKVAEGEDTSALLVKDLNGQSFKLNENDEIDDTARPVLVVNSEIKTLQMGKTVSDFVKIAKVDVLDKLVDLTQKYYQFNPDNEGVDSEGKAKEKTYIELKDSTRFMETPYDNGTKTVYNNYTTDAFKEFVSIRYYLDDGKFSGEDETVVDLSWYLDQTDVVLIGDTDYIVLDRNQEAPQYTFLTVDDANQENVEKTVTITDANGNQVNVIDNYQALVEEAAKDLYFGSNSYIYLPSMEQLITDNGGYQNLQFAISYKHENSESPSVVSWKDFNDLSFTVVNEGLYQFKIYAMDATENKMSYYINGVKTPLDSANVWEIEEIPTFYFTVKAVEDIKIEKETDSTRKVTRVLDATYTLSDFNVLGATGTANGQYGLYMVDVSAFNTKVGKNHFTRSNLYAISFETLAKKDAEFRKTEEFKNNDLYKDGIDKDEEIDYFKGIYARCLIDVAYPSGLEGAELSSLVSAMLDENNMLFREIEEYNDRINEEDHPTEWAKNNKYNWTASSKSFVAVEEGVYLMLASYTDSAAPAKKVAAYRVVIAEDEVDVLPGENDWFSKNKLAVIFFGIAGVMLIVIIVLLFVKPDKKTLEDVDVMVAEGEEKAAKKKVRKSKKTEKSDSDK